MGVFTCCWCLKLNYNDPCPYYTSFIFDAWLFIMWSGYSLGGLGRYKSWPHIIFIIISLCLLVMGIWAIIHLFTKDKGGFHKANYVKYRMWAIYGLVILAIVMFILWLIWGIATKADTGFWIGAGIYSALSLLIDAAVLHGYHENFKSI